MSKSWDRLCEQTQKAFDSPAVGDRFHESYSFWVYVLAVNDDAIVTAQCSGHPWLFPEGLTLKRYESIDEFKERFYRGTPQSWVMLCDRGNDVQGWLEQLEGDRE
jgi:hypothetical protein